MTLILDIKKNARWRHNREISERNTKTLISPLLFGPGGFLGVKPSKLLLVTRFQWFGLLFFNQDDATSEKVPKISCSYSHLPNNRAADLINFTRKNTYLHYTFIK